SPCAKWLARDVVAHVVEYTGQVLHGRDGKPTRPAPEGFDALAAFRATRADVERVLDDPATPAKLVEEIDLAVSLDLPQHRWDLAMATGQDATMNRADLNTLWVTLSRQSHHWWAFMRTPGKFGPGIEVYGKEVPVPADAPLQDRLLGLLGRDPAWTPPEPAASTT
ncbi:MAG TPA: TIGR03086 family protein, partial [Acidimicrobiia bacterium]|nr:TIGR03086 family protein [Acidimicrobiia bacterium]